MPKGIYPRTKEHIRRTSEANKSRNNKGKNNPAYKGGKVLDKNGYIRIRGSREARQHEQRLVMEQHLGRKLKTGEEVHHINGIKTDNRLGNLYLVDKKSHSRKHFTLFLKVQKLEWENIWLRSELKKYGWKPTNN